MNVDVDFNIESVLAKPTPHIEPYHDNNVLYVVSHIPYPMRYTTLLKKGYAKERIKAVVDAEKWFKFQQQYIEKASEINEKTHLAIMTHWEGMAESQKIIKELTERVKYLEDLLDNKI